MIRPAAPDETRRRRPVCSAFTPCFPRFFVSSRNAKDSATSRQAVDPFIHSLTKLKCCCLTVDTTLQKAVTKGAVRVEQNSSRSSLVHDCRASFV
jgi:hypothetical protein